MECPVTVPNPEVGTPPIQDGVQLLDHHIDASVRRKRPCHFTHALANIAAGLLTRPHTQHPTRRLTELEAEKRETFCQRRQPTLLLIHHQMKSGELTLESLPRPEPLAPFAPATPCRPHNGPAEHCRGRHRRSGTIDDLPRAERCWTASAKSPRPEANPGLDASPCLPP